jgi:hypothetical protein
VPRLTNGILWLVVLTACGADRDTSHSADAASDSPWDFNFSDDGADDGGDVTDSDAGDPDAETDSGPTACGTTPLPFDFVREDDQPRTDCLAPSVCLARDSTGPVYNAAQEDEAHRFGCESVSPLGTEWALGDCRGNDSTFTTLRVAHECMPMSEIGGRTFCMHVVEEDLWFDIEFIGFNGGTDGGGFSYRRRLAGGDPCGVGANCERGETGVSCTCPDGTGGDPTSFCI